MENKTILFFWYHALNPAKLNPSSEYLLTIFSFSCLLFFKHSNALGISFISREIYIRSERNISISQWKWGCWIQKGNIYCRDWVGIEKRTPWKYGSLHKSHENLVISLYLLHFQNFFNHMLGVFLFRGHSLSQNEKFNHTKAF